MVRAEDRGRTLPITGELAGFFDGEGTVEFGVGKCTLHIRLAFDENWDAHLLGILDSHEETNNHLVASGENGAKGRGTRPSLTPTARGRL